MEQLEPAYIPDKEKLWTWLDLIAKEDSEMAAAHGGFGDGTFLNRVILKWTPHILDVAHGKWDKHFVQAILIEYCDPHRIAFPDEDWFEDVLKKWNQGLVERALI